jgi:ADP-dependent phosphofructokinase/glucokinase
MNEAIALGLGNNVDFEIRWDSNIIESLIRSYGISKADLRPVERISTVRDLLISVLDYMRSGTGTERYVEDHEVIRQFAGNFAVDVTVGGTAARAAIALSRIGIPSSVHLVTMNDHIRRLMPADGSRWCSGTADSLHPHGIVQYEKGTRVAAGDIDIIAPVSTRLIYVNDHDNTVMKLDRAFFDNARKANACLISGFNAMRDRGLLQERLRELASLLETLADATTIFYEDACFHTAGFQRIVLKELSSLLDIFSLNEDEMQGYLEGTIDVLDPGSVLKSVRALHEVIPVPVLVIHTRSWALASGRDCAAFTSALKRGIAMAATRFRLGDHFSKSDFLATLSLPPETQGAAFSTEINRLGRGEVCCLPSVEMEEKKVTTIGLGDAFVGGFLSTMAGVQI